VFDNVVAFLLDVATEAACLGVGARVDEGLVVPQEAVACEMADEKP
jgi:hypothetical protein